VWAALPKVQKTQQAQNIENQHFIAIFQEKRTQAAF
jgi:hypothetical protein